MTIPEQIITCFKRDLAKINTDNLYRNNIAGPAVGYIDAPNDLPFSYFYLENAPITPISEDEGTGTYVLNVFVGVHFSAQTGQGNLTDFQETIMSDLSDWISGMNINHLDISNIDAIKNIYKAKDWRQIEWNENKGRCGIDITIKYEDLI